MFGSVRQEWHGWERHGWASTGLAGLAWTGGARCGRNGETEQGAARRARAAIE